MFVCLILLIHPLFLKFDIDIIYVECVLSMNRVRYPNFICYLQSLFLTVFNLFYWDFIFLIL